MMVSGRILLFIFLSLTTILRGYSQEHLTRSFETKLTGNKFKIQSLTLDSRGNIICGTDNGLFSFDGASFRPTIENDSQMTNAVMCLFNAEDGTLWIGYKNGRIDFLRNGEHHTLLKDDKGPSTPITSFTESKGGERLFISTLGEGIFIYENNSLSRLTTQNGLSDNYCYKIIRLPDDRFCVATDQGINFITYGNKKTQIIYVNTDNGLPDNIVRNLIVDEEQQLWLSFQEKGFCSIDLKTGHINIPETSINWSKGQVNSVLPLAEQIWIATESHGILSQSLGGNLKAVDLKIPGGKNENVRTLIKDNEGHVWIASGYFLIRSSTERWNRILDEKSSPFNFIHCILADNEGNIWFSPDQQLYCAKRQDDGSYKFIKYKITQQNRLTDIVTLWQDNHNNIWIGTLGEGVFVLNPKSGRVQHPGNHPVLLKGNVMAIEGNENTLLVGGFGGIISFLIHYDKLTGSYSLSPKEDELSKILMNNYIYSIHTDKEKRTWIGTDEKGLVLMENDKLIFFNDSDKLPAKTILSITSDSTGRIWLATQDEGIISYDGKKFEQFSINEGLSDPSPTSVIIDNNNNVLAIHSNGIDIFNPQSRSFQYYSSENGLGELNPDLNAISKDKDGRIWIGSERGIFTYHPPEDERWQQPEVHIEQILLFLQPIGRKQDLIFDYDQNNITIEYNSSWLTDPNRISYAYKLDGYSDKWEITKDKSESYPKLPPGKYTFKVKASLNNQFLHAKEATVTFEIQAPFWQKLWFRILLSITILLMILSIIKRRENRLRKAEQAEKEKIEFRFETLRSQVNPHFLFNSFNTLISEIERDPNIAIEYVENLSQFFRNIINYKDVELIPIHEELKLLETYIFIQSKRYGSSLLFTKSSVLSVKDDGYIPPLTLQLLAENAIKHNAISHESPLHIELEIKDDYLVLKNNINIKYKTEDSTGLGLVNIRNRFKILDKRPVLIEHTEQYFIVSVPILKK